MFQKMKARMVHILPAIVVSVLLVTGVLYAWTEPPVAPPNGNASTPLNVGSTGQDKLGNLMLNSDGILANALLVPFGRVGIGPVASVDNPPYDPLKLVDLGDSGRIVRVNNPIDAQDVATKAYVDAAGGGGGSGLKVVKASCAGGLSGCKATADCGAGWQIIKCHRFAAGPASKEIVAGDFLSGHNLESEGLGYGDTMCKDWNVLGGQSTSIVAPPSSPSSLAAIAVLCAKQ